MGSTAEHQQLVKSILLKYGSHPRLRLWANNTGVAYRGRRPISFGLVGSADILGVVAPFGQFIAIEVKTGKSKQTQKQKSFQAMIEKFGGIYILARSLRCVEKAIDFHQVII